MALAEHGVHPLMRSCATLAIRSRSGFARALTTSAGVRQEIAPTSSDNAAETSNSPQFTYDPNLVFTRRGERKLFDQQRRLPIGSRRRRAALASTGRIPFEQLPYQCFQEARKVLRDDRAEIVEDIRVQRERIARLTSSEVAPQNEVHKEIQLRSMQRRLQQLKIYADINDPLVKKKFEDGEGDMNKPIYRHLADLKWRSYKRKITVQRIEQMKVVPDVLPTIDPVVATSLAFGRRSVQCGAFVDSQASETAPRINIQPFDAGTRLVTIAVVNPDIPDVATDGFTSRCHFLASNISISPTSTSASLADLNPESQVLIPWLPPYSQKGAPYQRLAVLIFEQPEASSQNQKGLEVAADNVSRSRSATLDVAQIKAANGKYTTREGFSARALSTRFQLRPVGADLFRTQWDAGTAGVMQRLGVPGADVEFRRMRIEPLPYKRLKEERYR